MPSDSPFRDLIRRVRAGEEQAAAELLARYEPAIRRSLRARLRSAGMRRLLDSMDVCQSVMASFFVRAALGRYELDTPEDLLRLLASMARNKLLNQIERHRARRRDHRRVDADDIEQQELVAPGTSPSSQVATHELLEEARRRMSPEERRLLELRQQGYAWAEVASAVGGSPEALRKQLDRAIEKVAQQLGLDDE